MIIKTLYSQDEKIDIESYLTKCGIPEGEVEDFIYPDGSYLDEPYNYLNMRQAVEFIREVLENKDNKVTLICDSDADGILSSSLIFRFLVHEGLDKDNIKVLFHEGKQHGIEDWMIQEIKEWSNYLIVPDAGTNDVVQCKELSDSVKILILDHHNIDEENPYAIVVNNQAQENLNHDLCGTGVAFKFITAYYNPPIDMLPEEPFFNDLSYKFMSDMVAIANIGDVMDMCSFENRTFNYFALNIIMTPFLKFLVNSEIGDIPTPTDIAFKIIPLLNAVCRLEDCIAEKTQLFMSFADMTQTEDDYKTTIDMCKWARNKQRSEVNKILNEYENSIEEHENFAILYVPKTPYTGLIANKLLDKYNKVIFVIHKEGNLISGSARSPISFKKILGESGLMMTNKGHDKAWGIAWEDENTEKLYEYIESLTLKFKCDLEVCQSFPADNIPNNIFYEFESYEELWGTGLPAPLFYIHDIHLNGRDIKSIGANGTTIQFSIGPVKFIQFFVSKEKQEALGVGRDIDVVFDVVGTLERNVFMDRSYKQCVIKEVVL